MYRGLQCLKYETQNDIPGMNGEFYGLVFLDCGLCVSCESYMYVEVYFSLRINVKKMNK